MQTPQQVKNFPLFMLVFVTEAAVTVTSETDEVGGTPARAVPKDLAGPGLTALRGETRTEIGM